MLVAISPGVASFTGPAPVSFGDSLGSRSSRPAELPARPPAEQRQEHWAEDALEPE
ncbi:MAG TPA: hypothetical protein VNA89_07810 [Gemmatimonadaceae bacterium]|nr:hypothetical protein [Gemmatimonadaceae bacterium]